MASAKWINTENNNKNGIKNLVHTHTHNEKTAIFENRDVKKNNLSETNKLQKSNFE